MKQTLYLILYVVVLVIVGCTGKDSRSLSDIPEATVRTHADSLALAARFTGDFEHFLFLCPFQLFVVILHRLHT